LISALSLLLISRLLPGIHVTGFWNALWAAAILGVLNAVVRPILVILTLPLTIFTLGFFIIIINGLMLWMLKGLIQIDTFWTAVGGALLLSLINWLASRFINERGHWQYVEMRKGPNGRWS
jgi:putative membrane protein